MARIGTLQAPGNSNSEMRLFRVKSTCMKPLAFVSVVAVFLSGCSRTAPAQPEKAPAEQYLNLTLGGFIKGGNEKQTVDGVCSTDNTRNVLNCDIYNGLPDWKITELGFAVTWKPYSDEDARVFRQRVSIAPLTTASVTFRLGTQLPSIQRDWGWQIVGARGVPAQSEPN
jgi:hypothetical protein